MHGERAPHLHSQSPSHPRPGEGEPPTSVPLWSHAVSEQRLLSECARVVQQHEAKLAAAATAAARRRARAESSTQKAASVHQAVDETPVKRMPSLPAEGQWGAGSASPHSLSCRQHHPPAPPVDMASAGHLCTASLDLGMGAVDGIPAGGLGGADPAVVAAEGTPLPAASGAAGSRSAWAQILGDMLGAS